MRFVINGLKYDTENMEKVANVKKWYESRSQLKKGNWLLTHTEDYATKVGEAITEEEAKSLLMRYAPDDYEKRFEEIPEA